MKKRFTKWINQNIYLMVGYFFIWLAPLILLVIMGINENEMRYSFELWGGIVGIIIVIIYFLKLRAFIRKKVERELTEQNRVPVYLRFIQMFVSLIGFVSALLVIKVVSDSLDQLYIFLGTTIAFIVIGYIFLIIDSYRRKPAYLNRVKVRDSDIEDDTPTDE
jgi:putative Ca2+/H+ antiporter (TMEM165/GDT1 family)